MKKIIIMDPSDGTVHTFNYDTNVFDDYEDFYEAINEAEGFKFTSSQCDCMIVDELSIQIH